MNKTLKFAACQFPVTGQMDVNLEYILKYTHRAAAEGAHIVQFPEAALPGYARKDFSSFSGFNWQTLSTHTSRIMACAEKLKIWIVLGSCLQVSKEEKPKNCLQIISSSGNIIATYDKRKLYGKEALSYSKGSTDLTVTINGIKCGFLLCYDSCFPRLYESYRKQGVQLIFHSYYNAGNEGACNSLDDLILAQLRTRAADNQMWISASNSSERHSRLTACIARPDGSILSARRHIPGIVTHTLPDTALGWVYDNSTG
jgi:predicted amidohydrolase